MVLALYLEVFFLQDKKTEIGFYPRLDVPLNSFQSIIEGLLRTYHRRSLQRLCVISTVLWYVRVTMYYAMLH